MKSEEEVVKLSNGDIVIWTDEDSSLHIKCVTKFGDPVELNSEEVNELCEILQALAKRIS
jgi:hypothetical protein